MRLLGESALQADVAGQSPESRSTPRKTSVLPSPPNLGTAPGAGQVAKAQASPPSASNVESTTAVATVASGATGAEPVMALPTMTDASNPSTAPVSQAESSTTASGQSSMVAGPPSAGHPRPPTGPAPVARLGTGPPAPAGAGALTASSSFQFQYPPPPTVHLQINVSAVLTKCKAQLTLMDAAYEMAMHFFVVFTDEHFDALLGALLDSVQFARAFNSDRELRVRLWQAGFMRERRHGPPDLFEQESHGLRLYLLILLRLYIYGRKSLPLQSAPIFRGHVGYPVHGLDRAETLAAELGAPMDAVSFVHRVSDADTQHLVGSLTEERVISLSTQVLTEYLRRMRKVLSREPSSAPNAAAGGSLAPAVQDIEAYAPADEQSHLAASSEIVCTILDAFSQLSNEQFRKHLPAFYRSWLELIRIGGPAVRESLFRLFSERVTPLISVDLPAEAPQVSLPANLSHSAFSPTSAGRRS